MFMIFPEKRNYSSAQKQCEEVGGKLAHVGSEIRNAEIAKFLKVSTNSSAKEQAAYIGLNETKFGEFFTSNNEPLKCFNFRAWLPGEKTVQCYVETFTHFITTL